MTLSLRALGAGVAIALTAALLAGSSVPYTDTPDGQALVRLSWRAVGERVEECREATPAELAALPPHMRQREICEARLAPFHLRVEIDGSAAFEGRIRPGGARQDRPAYVFQEFRVAPGPHRLSIEFATEPGESLAASSRPAWTLDAQVSPGAREIVLVTTPPDADGLSVLDGSR